MKISTVLWFLVFSFIFFYQGYGDDLYDLEENSGASVHFTPMSLSLSSHGYWTLGNCRLHGTSCLEVARIANVNAQGDLDPHFPVIYTFPEHELSAPFKTVSSSDPNFHYFVEYATDKHQWVEFYKKNWEPINRAINYGYFIDLTFTRSQAHSVAAQLAFGGAPESKVYVENQITSHMSQYPAHKEEFSIPLEKLLPPFIHWHAHSFALTDGPNCFNAVKLAWSSILVNAFMSVEGPPPSRSRLALQSPFHKYLERTPNYEFRSLLEMLGFYPLALDKEPLKMGDVIVIKDLKSSQIRYGHAALVVLPSTQNIYKSILFTKNGLFRNNSYVFQTLDHVVRLYKHTDTHGLIRFRRQTDVCDPWGR